MVFAAFQEADDRLEPQSQALLVTNQFCFGELLSYSPYQFSVGIAELEGANPFACGGHKHFSKRGIRECVADAGAATFASIRGRSHPQAQIAALVKPAGRAIT